MHTTIDSSNLVICNISENNGHVMYGLGYTHAKSKPVIQICRDDSPLAINIFSSIRPLVYSNKNIRLNFYNSLMEKIKLAFADPNKWISQYKEPDRSERKVFICYSHKDKEYLERLMVHLKPLEKSGLIDPWVDTKLKAGDRWSKEIEKALNQARVAILLITADFIASDFIEKFELPKLLQSAEADGTRIIPLIIKPCRFSRDEKLGLFQAFNDEFYPVIRMNEADQEDCYNRISLFVENLFPQNTG